MSLNSYRTVDREQLAKDISALHQQALADIGPADFAHLKKMEWWGKACSILGYGTAWLMPNPLSALLISQGSFSRWTAVGHPIVHKAFDKVQDADKNYTSKKFAKGWRRFFCLAA